MTVKALKAINEITATYTVDEASVSIVFKFPGSFPLRPIDMSGGTGGRAVGVNDNKWRSWQVNASILAQNGSVLDALTMWKKNMKLHFEGSIHHFLILLVY
jgi:E3 ubiquitin-protein ligase listerin